MNIIFNSSQSTRSIFDDSKHNWVKSNSLFVNRSENERASIWEKKREREAQGLEGSDSLRRLNILTEYSLFMYSIPRRWDHWCPTTVRFYCSFSTFYIAEYWILGQCKYWSESQTSCVFCTIILAHEADGRWSSCMDDLSHSIIFSHTSQTNRIAVRSRLKINSNVKVWLSNETWRVYNVCISFQWRHNALVKDSTLLWVVRVASGHRRDRWTGRVLRID